MTAIASVFVECLPETSKIASGLRRAFLEADSIAAEAGKRWGSEIQKGIGTVKVDLDADTAKAEAKIDAMSRDRKATVEVDADTIGSSMQRGLSQGGEAGISALQPALMGVGVTMAAGVASALSGLAGLMPAALLGAGGVVGTLATGLDGVKDAWDAAGKASDSSGADQAAKAKEVASAQRTLRDAVVSEQQAQQDVANARKDALQQLRDLNMEMRGGALDEKQATLDALKARRDLQTGRFKDALDYEQAQLRVQEADQRVAEVHQRNIDLQTKATDAQAKGVDGADNVVRANQNLAKSHDAVTAAQQNLNLANASVSSSMQAMDLAMGKLSPNAQAFIETLIGMKSSFQELKNSVQDTLFAGVAQQVQALATQYMPLLKSAMGGMAGTMNQAFGQLAQFFGKPETMAAMQTIFANIGQAFRVWSQSIQPFAAAFLKISEVGSGFLPQLAGMVVQVADAFNQWAQSGQLGEWIQTGMTALQQLGGIIQTLLPMFGQLAPIGTATLGALQTVLTALAPAIQPLATAFASLITALSPLLGLLGQFISQVIVAIAPAFTQWFNAMAPVMQQLSSALLPVIQQLAPQLGQLAMVLSNAMVQGIQTLLPVLIPFVQQAGQLLVAVAPLLPAIVQFAISALPMMQQALATLLPVMTKWMGYLTNLANLIVPPLTKVISLFADTASTSFDRVKNAVTTVWGVVSPIFDLWTAALDRLTAPFQKLVDLVGKIPGVSTLLKGLGIVADVATTPPPPLAVQPGTPSVPGVLGGLPGAQAQRRGVPAPLADGSGAALFNAEGPQFYPQAFAHNSPFAVPSSTNWQTSLSPEEEKAFVAWVQNNNVPFDPSSKLSDYDMRGFWKETGGKWDGGHFPDTYKTPYDTTFSGESKYAKPGTPFQWQGDNLIDTRTGQLIFGGAAPQASIAPVTPTTSPSGASAALTPTSGYSSDSALLAGVPTNGTYSTPDSGSSWDLAKGLGDCSSAVEDLVNIMDGRSTNGRSMSTDNEAQWLTQHGFVQGMGGPGDFRVGFNSHHTQATLPGGTPFNWGSDAAAARGGVGGTGADDPAFTSHYYRPVAGGMPGGPISAPVGPSGGSSDPYYMKYPDGYQPPGPDMGQLGQSMGGDLGELFLPDGFKNPKDFGIAKLATGFINGLTGLKLGGQNDAGSYGGGSGGGGGLGGIPGMIPGLNPQPFGALQSGSPGSAPGEFMPLMPNPADAAISPFQVTGPPGTAGPGNAIDNRIVINNPVGQDHLQSMVNTATQAQVPRVRQGMRPLP